MPNDKLDSLHAILRGMIRQEIDKTPGFRELTSRSTRPANERAERTILGAILLDNAAHLETAALLPEDFALGSHRAIFQRMTDLLKSGRAVDIVTLAEELAKSSEIEHIGGVAYLASLTEGLPRRPVIAEYILIVKEKAKLRQVISGCATAIASCEEQALTADEIVAKLGIALKGIRGKVNACATSPDTSKSRKSPAGASDSATPKALEDSGMTPLKR